MSLTLQRTQNRLAWGAKNRSLCSEDRRLSLQTICTMWINCRWPIHLFRPLWQKWKCYCDDYTSAESSFQVVGTNEKARGSALFFSGNQFVKKFSDEILPLQPPGPSPSSSDLRRETDVHKLKLQWPAHMYFQHSTVHVVNQLHSFD